MPSIEQAQPGREAAAERPERDERDRREQMTSAVYGPVPREPGRAARSLRARRQSGVTRVARRAGRTLAISVTIVPTSIETITVRVAKTVWPCGRSIPKTTKSLFSTLARPSPRNSPATEPRTPITNASTTTDQSTWRREAPSVRSVANSRIRCGS